MFGYRIRSNTVRAGMALALTGGTSPPAHAAGSDGRADSSEGHVDRRPAVPLIASQAMLLLS